MTNQLILDRLKGTQKTLVDAYKASKDLKREHSTVIGTEREILIEVFLREMFPPQFRFGSGVITDSDGNKTGQLDIVIELPFAPSFSIGHGAPRIYLADTVGAVIEVKSNLSSQWGQMERQLRSGKKLYGLKKIKRKVTVPTESGESNTIPAYAVGYSGFDHLNQLLKKMEKRNNQLTNRQGEPDPWLRAVFQIDPPLFVGSRGQCYEEAQALGAFIDSLHWELQRASMDNPAKLKPYFGLEDDD